MLAGSKHILLAVLCLLLLAPILTIFLSVLRPDELVWAHLVETVLADYVVNSLILCFAVGAIVLLIGVAPAWMVSMYQFPGSSVLEWALLLPLAMPAYIIAYTYTGMLDITGPLQTAIRDLFGVRFGEYWFPEIRSRGGAIVMLSLVLYPYVYLLARTAFLEQSSGVLEVSRTLGCTMSGAFRRVALPLARPAIVAGLALVMMETLADYGTVQYFGVSTFTTGIFRTWFGLGSLAAAAQLSALLMTFILLLLILEGWSRRQAKYHHTSTRFARAKKVRLRGMALWATLGFCSLLVVSGFVVPFVQLLVWSQQTWHQVWDERFAQLVFNTLGLASLVALIVLVPALVATYWKRRNPGNTGNAVVRLLGVGYGVPGTVIAIGVLVPLAWFDNRFDSFMQTQFSFSTGLLLSGTLVALAFACVVRFLPLALNAVDAGLGNIKPSIDDAARSMGLRARQIVLGIHMPIMRGSILTAVLLVFVDVMKELPATLVLRPFNFNTLAVKTYELANDERLVEASTPALLIVIAGIIPVILLSRAITSSRPVT